ncbi:MAG: alpha/beta fold hydrolase [Achromobacter sp.]|uniref:PHA/PHB synthase family protein n=1 Tax=Achromobacter sp. TaxID=134375 RepID=UPI0012D05103|nr:alpha/beta fold hydrolase [Achromobacter sp.]MPS81273.1 alpha/beta fold hydrolase [Achromobacter sp.]
MPDDPKRRLPIPTDASHTPAEQVDSPFQALNHCKEALIATVSGGVSPAAASLAVWDWWIHLYAAPGKQLELIQKYGEALASLAAHATPYRAGATPAKPVAPRYASAAWTAEPFSTWRHAYQEMRDWWSEATGGVPGMTAHHAQLLSFCARQCCDAFAPANFPWSNPDVIARTLSTQGQNLCVGWTNLVSDLQRVIEKRPEAGLEHFKVGETLAVTPGAVVFQNALIELIQYAPTTGDVHPEPILITPAWIMKYYVLDLSPGNSLVRYLVSQGYTVFCISWRNVDAQDRDLTLDDYRSLGFMAALEAVGRITPGQRVHAVGYCLGGTLLSVAAATMARQADTRLATITLLAAQTDFTEPGGLGLYIDASEVYFLESIMWAQGYLSADQMAAAFQALRPIDETAERAVRTYLMGERAKPNDLVAWNADSTRMPYRMHAEYLRKLFLNNELAAGSYRVDGHVIALRNIRTPIFALGADRDRIAPWRSVFKIHNQTDAQIDFVLASGGHNAGIVSEPGHAGRWYRVSGQPENGLRSGPDEWLESSLRREGSWWPEWIAWLDAHSSPLVPASTSLGEPGADPDSLEPAPGSYVRQH